MNTNLPFTLLRAIMQYSIHLSLLSYRVVEFASNRDMKAALKKLDGSTLYGKRIRLIDVCIKLSSFLL